MASYMSYFRFMQTISFLYVLVTVKNVTASSVSHDEECSALFQLKQSITHPDDMACAAHGSQVFHSWNISFDCCSWEGVACSSDHDQYGHVIGLDLSEKSLCGHINSSSTLFILVHLQRLNLSGNDFGESQIPSEIARLKQLRILDLSDSGFSGQIPNEISQLIQLSSLDLSWNSLGLNSPSLRDLVQNLTGLEELHLSGVYISSSVPHFLANFSSLKSLQLSNCLLANEFPAAILELPKLQVLNLALNPNLSGSFPESLSHLKHLTVLSLTECSFSGPIPGSLSNLTQLTYLALGDNKFTGSVPSLVSLSKLEVLKLTGNRFQKGRFPNWLGKLTELSELFLGDMNINDEIPPFLANLSKISVIEMRTNSLIGRIPSWLLNYTQLTCLDLQNNQLQGPIPNTFSNFKSLQYLNQGKVMIDFRPGSVLKELDLSENRFTGQLPRSLTNCANLEFLCLGDNSFHDVFPSWLGTLSKLQVLVLRSNKLYGPIQGSTIVSSQFPKLRIIDLSNNSFSGQLHQNYFQIWHAMSSAKGVRTIILTIDMSIDLSCNHFEGEIPQSLQDLRGLQALNLSNNNFTGHVLPTLGNLENLQALDLSRNKLSGEIPQQLVQLSYLSIFNVSFNHLDGHIPQGKQFDTFENDSYEGNPRLCGRPLSKKCQYSKVSTHPSTSNVSESLLPSNVSESESLFPSERIDWIFVFCGVGSGLVVGVVIGNFLYERYSDRFTKRKDRWVRPLRNKRRNKGGVIA